MTDRPAPQSQNLGDGLEHMATAVTHAGPEPRSQGGVLNPPLYRASTIIYDTVAEYMNRHAGLYDEVIYGLYGTQTTLALADALAALEGGGRCVLTSSGTSAISTALAAVVKAGDHLLVVDTVYGPTRKFCEEVLCAFGVEVEFFAPGDASALSGLLRPTTRAVYLESPGSQTFEILDLPAITQTCRAAGVLTLADNTWATPLYLRPLDLGVDVSIMSATKYVSGHSDAMIGSICTLDDGLYRRIKDTAGRWGQRASPDDCYLVHRGLRTLQVRLERHERNGFALAQWLRAQPEVRRILHPGLPEDPGHDLWRRDFRGASGLFGFYMEPLSGDQASAFFDHLEIFRLGSSWGGYESLLVPAWPAPVRRHPQDPGALVRVHAGLESVEDLVMDLERAFVRLRALRKSAA